MFRASAEREAELLTQRDTVQRQRQVLTPYLLPLLTDLLTGLYLLPYLPPYSRQAAAEEVSATQALLQTERERGSERADALLQRLKRQAVVQVTTSPSRDHPVAIPSPSHGKPKGQDHIFIVPHGRSRRSV